MNDRTALIREALSLSPVIPVLVIDRTEDAVPLARALVKGGCRCWRSPCARPMRWR